MLRYPKMVSKIRFFRVFATYTVVSDPNLQDSICPSTRFWRRKRRVIPNWTTRNATQWTYSTKKRITMFVSALPRLNGQYTLNTDACYTQIELSYYRTWKTKYSNQSATELAHCVGQRHAKKPIPKNISPWYGLDCSYVSTWEQHTSWKRQAIRLFDGSWTPRR